MPHQVASSPTPSWVRGGTVVQAQNPIHEAFLDLGFVQGSLHIPVLGHLKALAWSGISNQTLLWVNVPLEIMRIGRAIKQERHLFFAMASLV